MKGIAISLQEYLYREQRKTKDRSERDTLAELSD